MTNERPASRSANLPRSQMQGPTFKKAADKNKMRTFDTLIARYYPLRLQVRFSKPDAKAFPGLPVFIRAFQYWVCALKRRYLAHCIFRYIHCGLNA